MFHFPRKVFPSIKDLQMVKETASRLQLLVAIVDGFIASTRRMVQFVSSSMPICRDPNHHKDGSDWASECGTIRSRRRSLSTSRLPRRQSRAPSMSPSRPSSPSTPSSSKTALCGTTPKAMSSASSGYNSLPRSHKSRAKSVGGSSRASSPKGTPRHSNKNSHSSIKVEVSSNPGHGIVADTKVDTRVSSSANDQSAMLTTTINGPNSTKIYLQQQNSPMRSVITFEKARKSTARESSSEKKVVQDEERTKSQGRRSRRPSSLYQHEETVKETAIKTK
ncbi:unnamed protein product, partial [Nesidiocoris tenuis]